MKSPLLRYTGWLAMAIACGYALLLVAIFVVMCQPPDRFGQIMARVPMQVFMVVPFEPLWAVARAGSLDVGDEAPDFRLRTVDKSGVVQLSSFRGKQPVALVFGSYT